MRQRLEDMTGCIPLYLHCFVGCTASTFAATWQTKFAQDKRVQRVFHHLLDFYNTLRAEHGEADWFLEQHLNSLRAFLLGGLPLTDLYDHRYLYEDDGGGGHVACGLARECVSAVIRVMGWDLQFVSGNFLTRIKTSSNPSVRGFLVEQACLTFIGRKGMLLPDGAFVQPQRIVYFDAGRERDALEPSSRTACALYIPRPFNYKAVDAVLRRVTVDKNEQGQEVTSVLLVPIQVTLSHSHKPSPEAFYPAHEVWLADIDAGASCQHVFVWLRRNAQEPVLHGERVRKTRGNRLVMPAYTEATVTFHSLSPALHLSTSPPRPSASSAGDSVAAPAPVPFPLLGQLLSAGAVHARNAIDRVAHATTCAHARRLVCTILNCFAGQTQWTSMRWCPHHPRALPVCLQSRDAGVCLAAQERRTTHHWSGIRLLIRCHAAV